MLTLVLGAALAGTPLNTVVAGIDTATARSRKLQNPGTPYADSVSFMVESLLDNILYLSGK
jgi:hypothetical protein